MIFFYHYNHRKMSNIFKNFDAANGKGIESTIQQPSSLGCIERIEVPSNLQARPFKAERGGGCLEPNPGLNRSCPKSESNSREEHPYKCDWPPVFRSRRMKRPRPSCYPSISEKGGERRMGTAFREALELQQINPIMINFPQSSHNRSEILFERIGISLPAHTAVRRTKTR